MTPLAAMDAACDDITADACRGWITHSRRFFRRYSLWCGWKCVAQQTGMSGGVGRLHCNSYGIACTVFPKEIVLCSHFFLWFFFVYFSLCYAVLYCPFCTAMTWSVNKLQTVKKENCIRTSYAYLGRWAQVRLVISMAVHLFVPTQRALAESHSVIHIKYCMPMIHLEQHQQIRWCDFSLSHLKEGERGRESEWSE